MRRADPSSVVLPDGEGGVLPTYADSDVGSSPRSIGVGGGRGGSLTEDPPSAVKWDDAAFVRVKLMCSYGGRILPRPHDNQLRYVGGESRIAVVSRNITFSELTSKLSRMFGASVAIKYQLPYEDLDALISVTSDEDLENMMEEYDRLQGAGNRPSASARLRLFLFPLKLERSQTASLSEMMENNHSRERWFVDILNGLQVLPRVRSETSSIVSETPDYLFQSNTADALEEWAAATSYGNSMPPHTEQSPENKQLNPVSAAALFGSLLQQAGSNEVLSAPGSPSPLKPKPPTMGSSSSAPPAIMSFLSEMVASRGPSTATQHATSEIDGSMGTFAEKTRLGSGDSCASVPEQRKHVDREILLTSDKNILNSSVGGAEQFLPAGLMDDEESSQKLSAKGSFDEVCENMQNVVMDAGLYQVVSEPSRALKGDAAPESPALLGQPIFDEEVLPVHILARDLNVLQLDERAPSPLASPSGVSSASAQISPTVRPPQQPISVVVMSKSSADDKSKPQAIPVSPPATVAHSGSEDKLMQQQILPTSAPHVMASKTDVQDGYSPSLAHFLPSLVVPQQVVASSNVAGEDTLMRQIPGANATKDVETALKVQAPLSATSGASPVPLPSVMLPILNQPTVAQKLAVPNYFYQAQAVEGPISVTTQAPGFQLPITSQTPSPTIGAATTTTPLPPIAAPFKPANVAVTTTRPTAGISQPQSPHGIVAGGGVFQHPLPHVPQIRTTSPPPSVIPSAAATNISQTAGYLSTGEALRGLAPVATNVSPPAVYSSMGEGIRSIPSTLYQQGEVAHLQRQVSDPMPTQRMAAISPHIGNQFIAGNLNAPPAPGVPTRFRAVGRPMQQVAEGIPVQQTAPVMGPISDKKMPVPLQQRGLTSASARPPLSPAAAQYSYFMADQPSVVPQPAAMGGVPRYNAQPNILLGTVAAGSPDTLPFGGANPFMDNFQPVSTYQDVPPTDQQQRRQMRS